MAVNPIEPIPKSQPDNSKLNTFTGHTVTVTKHLAPRNSVGQMVVPTQQMKLSQILELMTSIPLQYGPGYFRFTVSDTGGTGDDVWMVKLGPDMQEGSMASNVIPMGPTGGQTPPTGEGVIHLGHGFYYNPDLGTLTTPWRTVHNWKQGDQIPTQPTTASAAAPAGTPWWQNLPQLQNPAMPFASGWGGFPATDSSDSVKIRELEARLADEKRQRESDENRAEIRRIAEEAQKRSEEQARRFEALFVQLTAKPTGPSEVEQRLERELAEQRRREEERVRDDRRSTELRDMKEANDRMIRELKENKTDPMIPMLMTMMTGMQTQAQESVKAIQASTAVAAAATERSTAELVRQLSTATMSPMQLVTLMQSAKGDGAEMGRLMLDATKDTMNMQKEFYTNMLDLAGQNGQPAWVTLLQDAMGKIGPIGEALINRPQAPVMVQAPPQRQQMPQPQAQPRVVATPPRQAIPAGPMTAADVRNQAAAQVSHFNMEQEPSVHAAPMNGAQASAPMMDDVVPIKPQVIAPARAPSRRKPAKHRRNGRGRAAQPEAMPGPADPRGYTIEEMRALSPDDIRAITDPFSDEAFFGDLFTYVAQLRENLLSAETVAKYILQAREAAVQQGKIAPAIELLLAEQLEVVVARLYPKATDAYRGGVIQALADAIGAEKGDDDEEEEESDDEDGEADAQA